MTTSNDKMRSPAAPPLRPAEKPDANLMLDRDQWIARALAAAARHKKSSDKTAI